MIKTYEMLISELSDYKAPVNKLLRMIKEGKIYKLTKGLYETEKNTPGHLLANAIYGPSYLSFDYALAYYGLIPEAVYVYTSATFKKKKEKRYTNKFGSYLYRDIPSTAYPYEVKILKDGNYFFKIASPEKALCDKLYTIKPVKNKKELIKLIFIDLRIDEDEFNNLNKRTLYELCDLYHSTNLKILKKIIEVDK